MILSTAAALEERIVNMPIIAVATSINTMPNGCGRISDAKNDALATVARSQSGASCFVMPHRATTRTAAATDFRPSISPSST